MEHRRNDITPQPAHKNYGDETDAATSVAVTFNSSPKQVHPNLPSLEEVRREIAQVQPANFDRDQTAKMRSVLSENIHVFTNPGNELGLCTHAELTIDLSDNTPVRMQKYTTSDMNRKFIREPHHESTPKRMCVDYRFLNAKTTKRANANVLSVLRKNINGNMDHWSEYLRETTFQVNNQPHVGLHTSPFQLLYNYVPRRTIDNELSAPTEPQDQAKVRREEAQNTLTDYLHELKRKYDAKHSPPPFSVGDEVWYYKGSRATKLGPNVRRTLHDNRSGERDVHDLQKGYCRD
ncbi:hypothetical protein MTO96_033348 [Rhipicephalus appendiculatus]